MKTHVLFAIIPFIASMASATPVANPSPMASEALSGLVERQGGLLGGLLGGLTNTLTIDAGILIDGVGVYLVNLDNDIFTINQTLGLF
ncbi:uncharacterized protein Z520_02457 [Fonsecaea multimorphosa CBS 102226]|uniref:Uncharacterized protein n=1 Tax=Fonsecaea multimorphosa CBS 102226 TaxID=1442371 RepID=A0A0D2L001_9EURO|nr:uncharacterized protein Z520_02457 [Fonsecaea multimorphosa CBS 102226]KIY02319.1 hypothetical protein Z520_02457 [Fonsecaea multimorphosa CBS 102226]